MPFINPEITPSLSSRYLPNAPPRLTTSNMAKHAIQHSKHHVERSRSLATPIFTPKAPAFTSTSVPSSATSAFSTASFRNAVAQITNLARARSVKRRAAGALLLVLDLRDEVTNYEWESILEEVSAYSKREWESMRKEERRNIATQVLEDCGKMELIRDTIATYAIGKERVDEIMKGIAEEANEGIKKRLVSAGRMNDDDDDDDDDNDGNGEETVLGDMSDDMQRVADRWV